MTEKAQQKYLKSHRKDTRKYNTNEVSKIIE